MDDSALYDKVATKTLAETLALAKGETLTIETWGNGLPLAKRFVVEARRIGAIPVMLLEDESTFIEGARKTPKDVLGIMGKHEFGLLTGSDAYVFIPGPPLGAYAPQLDRQVATDLTKYNSSWYEAAKRARLRGARLPFGFVGTEYANLLSKRPEEVARNQLKASLVDLGSIGARAREIGRQMQDDTTATLQTGKATLELGLKGELVIEDGVVDEGDLDEGNNMTSVPPGYVSKQIEPESGSGSLSLSPTVTRLGRLKDATLEFREGRLVRARSTGSPKVLAQLIDAVEPERRVLSLLSVGINPLMKYDNGQDRLVAGAVGIGGFGFTGLVRNGTLSVGGRPIIRKGRLQP